MAWGVIATRSMTEEGNPLLIDHLAARAQAGCHDSFEKLVEQYQQPIYNFLLQMTRNVHDAEDLTQETFIRACQHVDKYNSEFKFSTWLFTIARNCAVTHFRKQKKFERSVEAEREAAISMEHETGGKPEAEETIWAHARGLKPNYFQVLWLHYHEGFSVQETASIMGSNGVYVKVLLHRARHALSKKLKANKD